MQVPVLVPVLPPWVVVSALNADPDRAISVAVASRIRFAVFIVSSFETLVRAVYDE